jgi:hypothetical protein
MSDSNDEWDGDAIDGREQWLGEAPYWGDGGETVDVTERGPTGEVVTENVPDPGEGPAADVPTWPPNPETKTEIRRRLLDGATTHEVGEWVGMSGAAVSKVARGESYQDIAADIPPLQTEGQTNNAVWIIGEGTEGKGGDSSGNSLSWPPGAETKTEIRRRLCDGATAGDVADVLPVQQHAVQELARGQTYADTPAEIGPLKTIGRGDRSRWEPAETVTTDRPTDDEGGADPDPEPFDETQELVPGDERPVSRGAPEPEAPTIPTRWIVVGLALIGGWVLSRLVGRDGGDR